MLVNNFTVWINFREHCSRAWEFSHVCWWQGPFNQYQRVMDDKFYVKDWIALIYYHIQNNIHKLTFKSKKTGQRFPYSLSFIETFRRVRYHIFNDRIFILSFKCEGEKQDNKCNRVGCLEYGRANIYYKF